MEDRVTIIERWYPNRVERYVVMKDGSLMPLEVWKSDPFVLLPTNKYLEPVSVGIPDDPILTEEPVTSALSVRSTRRGE
jgi:hypothetical protein